MGFANNIQDLQPHIGFAENRPRLKKLEGPLLQLGASALIIDIVHNLRVDCLFKIARFSNFVGTGRLREIAAPSHVSPYGCRGR